MNRCRRRFLIASSCVLLIFCHGQFVIADGGYAAKAEQVYKFAVYVRWAKSEAPLVFCVKGNQAFKDILKEKLANKKNINGRKPTVGQSGCSIIVGVSQSVRGGAGVLTISDAQGFAENGGMIEFISANGRSFNINNTVAKKKGVGISAHLLKLAKKVY